MHWNSKSILGELLDAHITSLLGTDYDDFIVLIVDNGSKDGTPDYIQGKFRDPRLKILRLSRSYSFAIANNIGLNYAMRFKPDVIVFINNDTIVKRDWLRKLIEAFKDPNVGAAQPLIMNFNGTIQFLGGFVDKLGRSPSLGSISGSQIAERFVEIAVRHNVALKIYRPLGACVAVRAELLKEIKGFNPYLYFSHEELALATEIYARGYKIVCVPNSVIYHKYGPSLGRRKDLVPHAIANKFVFIILYMPRKYLFGSLVGRLIFEIALWVKNMALRRRLSITPFIVGLSYTLKFLIRAHTLRMGFSKIREELMTRTPLYLNERKLIAYAANELMRYNISLFTDYINDKIADHS
ncbi:glycosyltransferase [Thermoproteus tenax]|uniref:Glycosyltransferase n=1 Tax=Thermoproteus tenax (strain ATCC 35583 / DSM 2078 / JCM 9277 / NBRC 100435 / Kra 1) TaxID=768679 RepID=G4RK91_THETK|nr:glycosyltransferase [Thermoproteus tenax]CCC81986.1 glycosyltransferase [Thermoproteus tenax Kra 1]